jgi:hypothetical protein
VTRTRRGVARRLLDAKVLLTCSLAMSTVDSHPVIGHTPSGPKALAANVPDSHVSRLDPQDVPGISPGRLRGRRCAFHKLEEMLAADERPGGFLEMPLDDVAAHIAAHILDDSEATRAQWGLATLLGPYRLEKFLGSGGMAEVFQTVDTRLGRRVAVKICFGKLTKRFKREARAISVLNHRHVCTLYDVGPDHLVMELVEGETLRDWLQRAPPGSGSSDRKRSARCAWRRPSGRSGASRSQAGERDDRPRWSRKGALYRSRNRRASLA